MVQRTVADEADGGKMVGKGLENVGKKCRKVRNKGFRETLQKPLMT